MASLWGGDEGRGPVPVLGGRSKTSLCLWQDVCPHTLLTW